MSRAALFLAALLLAPLATADLAEAQQVPNPMARDAANAALPDARTNLGLAIGSVTDFGADPTGVADSTAALNAAFAANATTASWVPCGTYKISATVTLPGRILTPGRGCATFSWAGGNSTTVLSVPADGVTFLGVKKGIQGGLTLKNSIGATGLTFLHVVDTNRSGFEDLIVDATNTAGSYSTGHTCIKLEAATKNSGLNNFHHPILYGCKTGVSLVGASGSVVVTDNTFHALEARLGTEVGGIGIDFVAWADTNIFTGTTLIAPQSNNSTCIVQNSGSPTGNVGVYDNNFYYVACDAFGITGATGIKINFTKQFSIFGFYHSPDVFPGTLIDETPGLYQTCYIVNNSMGTGINAAQMQIYTCGAMNGPTGGLVYSTGIHASQLGGGPSASFRYAAAGDGGFSWANLNQPLDRKYWDFMTRIDGGGGSLVLRALNDANNAWGDGMVFNRTAGAGVANVTFPVPIVATALPANCTGQPTGALWNDAGTVKVCP